MTDQVNIERISNPGEHLASNVLTLRDYFAAQYVSNYLGSPTERAKYAYAQADAMLAERAK